VDLRLGITTFATDRSISVVDLAREAEQRGFASLFLPEHTHIPTSRRTPPPTGETELAEEYKRTIDPFVALAGAAAVTREIRLGTGICLVAQHDPIVLAKQVASLDHLSNGRFVFGIGFGWNREEMADHGIEFLRRRDVVREKTVAMHKLWADERAGYEGEFVRFEESWSWPKPIQRPRPPILIGGAPGPILFRHIAEYADGWIPIGGAGVAKAIPALRQAFVDAGRDPDAPEIVPIGTVPDPGKLDYYRSLGIREVVLRLPSAEHREAVSLLDEYARLIV